MAQSSRKKTNQSYFSTHRILIYAMVVSSVLLLIDLSPLGGSNVKLYVKWASCGSWPIETMGYHTGQVPNYRSAAPFLLSRGADHYFCTPLEAEQAGYSANPNFYDYPHLNEKE